MVRILSILILSLSIALFPPAALAVISNNAVPGDATYPIKRGLENVIYAVASLNPTTKAWFAAARSDRRFKEITVLITKGKVASKSLNELVEQTEIAANQIAQVNDSSQKAKLIEKLSQSIKKYDQGLQQLSPSTPSQTVTQPQASVQPTPVSVPISRPTPQPTQPALIQPTSQPTLEPSLTPTPSPLPSSNDDTARQKEIEEARRRLEEINRRMEEEKVKSHSQSVKERKEESKQEKQGKSQYEGKKKDKKVEDKEDKDDHEDEKEKSNLTPNDKTDLKEVPLERKVK